MRGRFGAVLLTAIVGVLGSSQAAIGVERAQRIRPGVRGRARSCARTRYETARPLHRPRRAVGRLRVEPAGIGQRRHLHGAPARRTRPRCPSRTRRAARGTSCCARRSGSAWCCATRSRRRTSPTSARPDSDANNKVSPNPSSPNYIGKHPGNAFMEVQWYSPGYVEQFDGFGCTATQYCAALTIDSFSANQNTGQSQQRRLQQLPARR